MLNAASNQTLRSMNAGFQENDILFILRLRGIRTRECCYPGVQQRRPRAAEAVLMDTR